LLTHSFSVKQAGAKASVILTGKGHGDAGTADRTLAGAMKPNLVRGLIQRGALP
jgi:hypothetical protein